jgi:RNA polymerase sigma-70 factor, ECF subfamily
MTPGQGESSALAEEFEAHRPRLTRLAYATTGSLAEAEDCVQEAWLRLQRATQREPVRELGAWLTTTVSRLALDALDRSRVRRQHHAGPWLPEPLVEILADQSGDAAPDPADRVTLDESVSMALLVAFARRPPVKLRKALVNGAPGLVVRDADGILSVMTLTLDDGRIVAVDVIRNPDKLSRVAELLAGDD